MGTSDGRACPGREWSSSPGPQPSRLRAAPTLPRSAPPPLRSLLALLLLLSLLALTPPARTVGRTLALLPELLDAPVLPLEAIRPTPGFRILPLRLGAVSWNLHLYQPAHPGRHPALLLELGISPDLVYYPRAVELGEDLARAGYLAALVDSPYLTRWELRPEEADVLVGSFRALQGLPEVRAERIALGGFSVGGSMALLGAADARIHQEVAAVLSFGGYYDVRTAALAVTSRQVEGQPWSPDATSVHAFQRYLLSAVDARPELWAHVLQGEAVPPRLTPAEAQLLRLLEDPSSDIPAELEGILPARALQRALALSPALHLERVEAPLFILHDRGDAYIPATESRALVAAARALGKEVHYAEFALFEHVQPVRPVGPLLRLQEAGRLGWTVYRFFRRLDP